MSVPEEFKWLYKELWAWRAFGLLILVLFLGIEIIKWRTLNTHDGKTEVFQTQSIEKFDRLRLMVDKNWSGLRDVDNSIQRVNENLYACLRCHAHSSAVMKDLAPKR